MGDRVRVRLLGAALYFGITSHLGGLSLLPLVTVK